MATISRTANALGPSDYHPRQTTRACSIPASEKVGPEHFGIVCFDCAKRRSKFLLADFYGKVLIPPTLVEHNRSA